MSARFYSPNSIGLKAIMAITGIILFAFAAFHLFNNVHIDMGRETYNTLGFAWKTPVVISIARPVLFACISLHAIAGIALARSNRRARPQRYAVHRFQKSSVIGRGMIVTGMVGGAYIAYHILHAKVGTAHPELFAMLDEEGRRDVYNIMILSYRQPVIATAYIMGLAGLFVHTTHGVTSIFSTLGILNDRNRRHLVWIGAIASVALFLGYASIPFNVLIGTLQPVL